MAESKDMKRVLIFGGKTGWIGQMMAELVKKEGERMNLGRQTAKRSQCLMFL